MSVKFFQTVMGRRFIESVVPTILSELTKLNKNLSELNKNLERVLPSEQDEENKEP